MKEEWKRKEQQQKGKRRKRRQITERKKRERIESGDGIGPHIEYRIKESRRPGKTAKDGRREAQKKEFSKVKGREN